LPSRRGRPRRRRARTTCVACARSWPQRAAGARQTACPSSPATGRRQSGSCKLPAAAGRSALRAARRACGRVTGRLTAFLRPQVVFRGHRPPVAARQRGEESDGDRPPPSGPAGHPVAAEQRTAGEAAQSKYDYPFSNFTRVSKFEASLFH
jgi:hypothetical protein